MLYDRSCNTCDRRDGDGDGHCYKFEVVMHVIDVMAMVIEVRDIVIGFKLYHLIDVILMVIDVMDNVIGLKLLCI